MPVDLQSFPMHLFIKSQTRAWQPAEIDFAQDRRDWEQLNDDERELMLRLVAGFYVGERGVTHDLAPLQYALRQEKGRIEEEMYVTAQLFEEARHVEFFQRWLDETLPGVFGRDIPYPELSGDLFSSRLRDTMGALLTDSSNLAMMRAVTIYHLYVEGVGAESSYPLYFDICAHGIFPGLLEGIRLIRRDEARHIAFGTYLMQRLLDDDPNLEAAFIEEFDSYQPMVEEGNRGTFAPFEGREVPFGVDPETYRRAYLVNYAKQRENVLGKRELYEVAAEPEDFVAVGSAAG